MTSILRRIELALWLILAAAFWLLADVAAGSPAHSGIDPDVAHGLFSALGLAVAGAAFLFYGWQTRGGREDDADVDRIILESVTLKVQTVNVKMVDDEPEARVH